MAKETNFSYHVVGFFATFYNITKQNTSSWVVKIEQVDMEIFDNFLMDPNLFEFSYV